MSKKKRAPKELQTYVVVAKEKDLGKETEVFRYFRTQKEAKEWARDQMGTKSLFKIKYEFVRDLK